MIGTEERFPLEPAPAAVGRRPSAVDARREVIQAELTWHEQEAHRRDTLDELLYDPPAFDAVVQPAIDFLEARPGERVLDMGCGEGKETLALAQRGLVVVSMDLSHMQLSRAREMVSAARPAGAAHFVQANAEEPPFAPGAFRIVYGKAILHHLDLATSAGEVERLLVDGGRATFAEPLARHPLIWLGRVLTPKLRTRDERPMGLAELEQYAAHFHGPAAEVHFLFAPVAYLLRWLPGGEAPFQKVHALLAAFDRKLFRTFPALRRLAWYASIRFVKSERPF